MNLNDPLIVIPLFLITVIVLVFFEDWFAKRKSKDEKDKSINS